MIGDLRVVLGKEWLELRRSDSPWIAAATLVVFLGMIGFLSPVAVVIQALSKIVGALIVWWGIRRREQALA